MRKAHNRARQAAITAELMDIVGGAEAFAEGSTIKATAGYVAIEAAVRQGWDAL